MISTSRPASSAAATVTGVTRSSDFPTLNAVRANDALLKSADGGATWQPGNKGLQNRPVTRLWADPSSASTLYALTFNGLYKSTLAGAPDQTQGRAGALRRVAEDADLRANEKNRAFVLMQYHGYLRRNPNDAPDSDFAGYLFWLAKLNEFGGDFVRAEMVKAFLDSDEYKRRFGQ